MPIATVITLLDAILSNLPAEESAFTDVKNLVVDFMTYLSSGNVTQVEVDALIAKIKASSVQIQTA